MHLRVYGGVVFMATQSATLFLTMVASCSRQPKKQRFFLQWHASRKQAVSVHVSACGGDKDLVDVDVVASNGQDNVVSKGPRTL